MASRPSDGEAFIVEQALDLEDQVDIFLAVHAVAARTFDRLEHGEFRFPIAKNEGLELSEAADFADAIELLFSGGLCCGAGVGHSCWFAILTVCGSSDRANFGG